MSTKLQQVRERETHRVVLDSTAARGPGRNTEINTELGLPAALAQHAAAWLLPVDPVDDAIERLAGVHPDGHRAAHALNVHAGDELLCLAGLCCHLGDKNNYRAGAEPQILSTEYQWEQVMMFVSAVHVLLHEQHCQT